MMQCFYGMLPRVFSLHTRLCLKKVPECVTIGISTERSFSNSTVDNEEVRKFERDVNTYFSSDSLLKTMNMVRVPFIRDGMCYMTQRTTKDTYPLKGFKIIDVGCGGGLLSEPLARLGASVTGLDPGQESIDCAVEHVSKDEEIKDRLTYICDTVENVAISSPCMYDAVVCSEVIEHVADVQLFLRCCVEITKDGGSLFFTTINRSLLSYMIAIVGAEYVLKFIKRGTHDWNKFITPNELSEMLRTLNCRVVSKEGYMYNPFTKKFSWTRRNDSFYALHVCK